MPFFEETLAACPLFAGLNAIEIHAISAQASFRSQEYSAGEVVAFEDDECSALGILASGSVHIQRIFENGKLVTIETFGASDSFGEALMFADRAIYPATLIAKEKTVILYIARADIIDLCSRYPAFLDHFLRTLSNRILLLNRKIKSLSFQSIRQKVANYILEECQRQGREKLALPLDRSELADHLGIPRPSLSRELATMKAAGWLEFNRRTIQVFDKNALIQTLKE